MREIHSNIAHGRAKKASLVFSEMQYQTIPQPPYSPDIAHCDFWQFPKFKMPLERYSGQQRGGLNECDESIHGHSKVIDTGRLLLGHTSYIIKKYTL